jgi:di/tricarboxylate transporter
MLDQVIVFAVLFGALILFVWGKPRYDVVAIMALVALVVLGVTPASSAFDGFGHAAVITVAMILILSVGLIKAGIVDIIVTWLEKLGDSMMIQLGALLGIVTVASAFMNNVGALALVMPVAIRLAYRSDRSPSIYLMPLAFGSLLGGITTLIGTPPNIIISGFRERATGEPFAMFDFFPAGGVIALVGLLFILFLGWRLTPKRQPGRSNSMFKIEDYLTEVRVPAGSRYIGKPLDAVEAFHETDAVPLGLARTGGEMHMPAP